MALESVVKHWLSITLEDESAVHDSNRMVEGRSLGIFYANDGLIGLRKPEWLQGYLNVLI